MNDVQRENAEHCDDGHVTIQLAEGKKTITVDHSVLEYISHRKKEKEKELEDKQLLEKAVTMISEFDEEPFDFTGNVMLDRIFENECLPDDFNLVRMKSERIREYGLFCIMLKILKENFVVYQNCVFKLRNMVNWLLKLLWKDTSKTIDERNELNRFIKVLPYTEGLRRVYI